MTEPTGPVEMGAVGSLPAADPLRAAMADRAQADQELSAAWDAAEAEEGALRDALLDVDVPADLEARLEALADDGSARLDRIAWAAVYLAAAAVFLLLVLQPWPKPEPVVAEAIAAAETEPPKASSPDEAPVPAVSPTPQAEATPAPRQDADAPKLLAVKFWHRTCPACKVLDPVYADVVERLHTEPVLWVTFDMSTKFSRDQSALMASTLGIRELYDDRFGSSGYVVLLDADTLEVLGELTTKDAEDVMIERVLAAVGRA